MSIANILTNDGMSQSIIAQNNLGYFIKIKSFGVSDIAGTLDPTRLNGNTEWYNGLIAYGHKINDNTIEVMCVIPPNAVGSDKNVEELYLYGEDTGGSTFLLSIAHPTPTALYTPTAELSFKIQITIQNLDVSSVYQYVYTQAQEILAHNLDPNAHPPIRSILNKHGIYVQEINRKWSGQTIDGFVIDKLDAAVINFDAVYWHDGDSKFKQGVQDDSNAQDIVGLYIEDTESIVSEGIVDYTHSLDAFTNIFLSKTNAGELSTNYSSIMIGYTLPDNKLYISIKNLVKYGAVVGGSGGSGSFMPIMGDTSPIEDFIDGLDLLSFGHESEQSIYFNFKIPEGYVAGSKLVLAGGVFYCETATSGNVLFKAETALLKKGSHVFGTFSDIHNSTNSEVTVSSTLGEQTLIGNIDLTDNSGQINSIDVEEGDVLRIRVYRDITNETTSVLDDAKMIRTCFEPKKVLA